MASRTSFVPQVAIELETACNFSRQYLPCSLRTKIDESIHANVSDNRLLKKKKFRQWTCI